jgi:hypothetical protein
MPYVEWCPWFLNGLNGYAIICYHLSSFYLPCERSPFIYSTWSHKTHVPESLAVRGWRRHNRSTVFTIGVVAPGVGFSRYLLRVCQVHLTRVHFGEPISASLKEENGGGLSSSFFGRLRCRRNPDRGFWTS